MEIQAYFSDIRETIATEINLARQDIFAAVAWITDPELFDPLVAAAKRGVRVKLALLQDSINNRSTIAFERLTAAGGRICWISEPEGRAGTLHHKFCVIDREVVVTGSFNWTRRASQADENIILVRDDPDLVAAYDGAFRVLLEKHGHATDTAVIDTEELMRRLEVVRNLIMLADADALATQLPKLEQACTVPGVAKLIDLFRRQEWDAARTQIEEMLDRGMSVVEFQDPEIAALRLEAMALEAELVALSAEQAELERLIREFDLRQHDAIGDILAEYLRLKHEYLRRQARHSRSEDDMQAEKKAAEDYDNYRQASEAAEHEPRPLALSEEERAELKSLYRAAAMHCHPDRVADEDKALAQTLFIQIKEAYEQGDLETLRELHQRLVEGRPFGDRARTDVEKTKLQKTIVHLSQAVAELVRSIRALRESETYRTLSTAGDWDVYFAGARFRLKRECADLQCQLNGEGNG